MSASFLDGHKFKILGRCIHVRRCKMADEDGMRIADTKFQDPHICGNRRRATTLDTLMVSK